MDVLCSLVQQDIAEVEKEDREMAARTKGLPSSAVHHGGAFHRSGSFNQIDHSQYAQHQLASIPSHMSDTKPSGSAPSLAEMAYSSSPANPLRHQVFMNQQRPQIPMMGNQLTRQHSAQPSWKPQDGGLRWQPNNLRRTSSAPNEGPRQPLYPGVPSRNVDTDKKPDVIMEKLETAPRRSIKKAAGGQKAKKRRSSLQLPGDVYCRLCGTRETPEWRRGPDGLKSLCNACGIHFARMMRAERKVVAAKEEETRRKAKIGRAHV